MTIKIEIIKNKLKEIFTNNDYFVSYKQSNGRTIFFGVVPSAIEDENYFEKEGITAEIEVDNFSDWTRVTAFVPKKTFKLFIREEIGVKEILEKWRLCRPGSFYPLNEEELAAHQKKYDFIIKD